MNAAPPLRHSCKPRRGTAEPGITRYNNNNPDPVGHPLGAQMGALNLALLAPVEPAPVPLPPELPAMLSGLVTLALIGRRRNPLR
jgi:hypothetical protein